MPTLRRPARETTGPTGTAGDPTHTRRRRGAARHLGIHEQQLRGVTWRQGRPRVGRATPWLDKPIGRVADLGLAAPDQRAARFSANEARPSAASGERRLAAWLSTSASNVARRSRPTPSAAPAPWSRPWPPARSRAPARPSPRRQPPARSSGTTWCTRPMRCASAGAEALAGQRVAAHLAHRDGVAELRQDDGRRQPPAHLGDGEDGVVGGDDDVAGRNDAGAAAEAAALHQRDRRHGQPVEAVDGLGRGAADARRSPRPRRG